jgi:hypothetical protein
MKPESKLKLTKRNAVASGKYADLVRAYAAEFPQQVSSRFTTGMPKTT